MSENHNQITTEFMKTHKVSNPGRPLLALVALVVAFTVVSLPMAKAVFYNYVRDAFTGWESGSYTDANADANVAICEPVVQNNATEDWMVEPLSAILEVSSSYKYLDAFYSSASAYRSWYMYYAFNDMANLSSYLETAESIQEAYYELNLAYSELYSEESSDAYDEYFTAFASAPLDEQDSARASYPTCWSAYYDAKGVNDDYWNYAAAEYGYNTWSYYSAPYYGTAVYLSKLSSLLYDDLSNARSSAYFDYDMPVFGTPEYEDYEAYTEELADYYEPLTEYYSAYAEYYRGLSDYYEG
jgi:hypothetical protein